MDATVLVFVYGTLRPQRPGTAEQDSRYHCHIAPHVISVREASLSNAELYDLGEYPGAMPGRHVIRGDLLEVASAALPIMDRIEGHPVFFRRRSVTVQTSAGDAVAWIYWAPDGLTYRKPRIPNGDWLLRRDPSNGQQNPVDQVE